VCRCRGGNGVIEGAVVSANARVSIVTPFLNPGRFFQEAIDSVLAQTFDGLELLLVDDGSTDDSASVALRSAAEHPSRVRYLSHAGRVNRGASASRNLGIRHATGDYLAFLDADDVYLPDRLEQQVAVLDANPDVAMVYAATEYWYSWSGRPEDARRDWTWRKYGAEPNVPIAPPRMLRTFLEDGGTVPCMGSVLVRRQAVESVGGWEESFRNICTDQVFHAKLCLRFPVYIVDACRDRYRQHPDSVCHTVARAGKSDAAFDAYLRWLECYLVRERVTNREVWNALRTARRRVRRPLYRRMASRAKRVFASYARNR
jgi:glycosyltransferase involved in cell wall biosynthesis